MPWPIVAAIAGSALLGALSGRKQAKAASKPTITKTTVGAPPAELGGYGRISSALDRLRDWQPYRVGQGNPYLQNLFGHVAGRAGMTPPEAGWGNPYMPQNAQPQAQSIPPELIEWIRNQMQQQGPPASGMNIQGGP